MEIIIFLLKFLIIILQIEYYNIMNKTSISFSKLFIDTQILDPVKKQNIMFKTLWENSEKPLTIITFLRRFGWPLCRLGAFELSEHVNSLNEQFPNILNAVAVGLATLDYEDFKKADYFSVGEVYIDEKKQTYDSLSFGKMTALSGYGMLNPMVYIESRRASNKGITGNMQGDGIQLGGTFIVDKEGEIVFTHVQQSYTDHPTLESLKVAVEDYAKRTKF